MHFINIRIRQTSRATPSQSSISVSKLLQRPADPRFTLPHHETTMASLAHDFERVSDCILSRVELNVSGACGPARETPLDCFHPVHQAYSNDISKKHAPIDVSMATIIPGGVPRPIESAACSQGHALVYDRDIITTWRLPDAMSAYQIFF